MASTKIVLDTNFLICCLKQRIALFDELDRICDFAYELVVLPEVRAELEFLSRHGEKLRDREAAMLVLNFLQQYHDKFSFPSSIGGREAGENIQGGEWREADKAIVAYVETSGESPGKIIVATLDKELKEKLKSKVRFLVIREGTKLELL